MREWRVKGSLSMMDAQIELKTRPDAWSVERTGNGRVVICIVLPTKLETMNMSMPSCHLRRLYGGLRSRPSSFSSSSRCDFRCSVKPILCILVESNPTMTPRATLAPGEISTMVEAKYYLTGDCMLVLILLWRPALCVIIGEECCLRGGLLVFGLGVVHETPSAHPKVHGSSSVMMSKGIERNTQGTRDIYLIDIYW